MPKEPVQARRLRVLFEREHGTPFNAFAVAERLWGEVQAHESSRAVGYWINGRRDPKTRKWKAALPSATALQEVCEEYRVRADWLLGLVGEDGEPLYIGQSMDDPTLYASLTTAVERALSKRVPPDFPGARLLYEWRVDGFEAFTAMLDALVPSAERVLATRKEGEWLIEHLNALHDAYAALVAAKKTKAAKKFDKHLEQVHASVSRQLGPGQLSGVTLVVSAASTARGVDAMTWEYE